MKRQILFLIFCYIALFACIASARMTDKRPPAHAAPIPAPIFIWPSEVSCEAN